MMTHTGTVEIDLRNLYAEDKNTSYVSCGCILLDAGISWYKYIPIILFNPIGLRI